MKKLFLLLAVFGLLFTACGPVDDGNDLTFIDNTNTNPVVVAGGGMVNITFTTEYNWLISTNVDWLTISKTSGVGGLIEFFITAAPNKFDNERVGIVTITLSNDKTYKITVTQEPNEGIKHLVCQDNEILYTTKYNLIVEKDFLGASGFGESASTLCMNHEYLDTYGKITFNNDVTQLPDYAFADCASMEVIYLPNGVKSVGKSAFKYCTALHSIISINSVDNRALVIDNCLCAVAPANLVEYTIPAGVIKIGAGAFSGCKTLTKVTIPEGVVEIEAGAFEDCENLNTIEIPRSLTKFNGHIIAGKCNEDINLIIPSDHSHLLRYTTSDNKPIELYRDINVLDGFDSDKDIGYVLFFTPQIYRDQFWECSSLTSIFIPNSITEIEERAFGHCTSLTSITIPDSVTSIGRSAFESCTSLTSITIPDSVTEIGKYAFWDCTSLTSVTIPDGVTSIGSYAFYECTSLTSVYCKPSTPPTAQYNSYWGAFNNNAYGRKIYVPTASVDAYKAAEGWSDYADDIVGYDF